VDEKEYIYRKVRKARIQTIIAGVWMIAGLPIMTLSYDFIIMMIVFLTGPLLIIAVGIKDEVKGVEIWLSRDSLARVHRTMAKILFPFLIVLVLEFPILFYVATGKNMLSNKYALMSVISGAAVIFFIPLVLYTHKMEKKLGNFRQISVKIGVEDAKTAVKNALDSLKIPYTEFERSPWKSQPWHLKINNGMEISVTPDPPRSIMMIYHIPKGEEKEEREIERAILEKIDMERK
jgi:hypothetical protein